MIKTWKLGEGPVGLGPSTSVLAGAGVSEVGCQEAVSVSAVKAPK